jgi:hypothetical protein
VRGQERAGLALCYSGLSSFDRAHQLDEPFGLIETMCCPHRNTRRPRPAPRATAEDTARTFESRASIRVHEAGLCRMASLSLRRWALSARPDQSRTPSSRSGRRWVRRESSATPAFSYSNSEGSGRLIAQPPASCSAEGR